MTAVAPQPIATRPYPTRKPVKGSTLLRLFRTTDHKQLGIMYLVTTFAFFLAGGAMAMLIRTDCLGTVCLSCEWILGKYRATPEELAETGEVLQVPGDAAAAYYVPKGTDGQPAKFLKAKPLTDMKKCTKCGYCVTLCPVASIDPKDVANVPGICIKCQACVRGCPVGAKYFDDPAFLSHVKMLEQNFTERKENSFFL